MSEYKIRYVDINQPVKPLGPIPKKHWENLITTQTSLLTQDLYRKYPVPSFKPSRLRRPEYDILVEILAIENQLHRNPERMESKDLQRKEAFYSKVGADLRRRGNEKRILDLMTAAVDYFPNATELEEGVLGVGCVGLYLFACEPNRFLVGLKGGAHWKNIEIPLLSDSIFQAPLLYLAEYYMGNLHRFGRDNLDLVPTRLIHPDFTTQVTLPKAVARYTDLLEDAYYYPKYRIPEEGAETLLREAGHAQRILMAIEGNDLVSKVETTKGQGLVVIGLDDASWSDPVTIAETGIKEPSAWTNLVISIYHDIVTQEELPRERHEALEPPKTRILTELDKRAQRPYYIYIPRRIFVGEKGDPRFVYDGPRRPPRPHRVKYSIPKRPITEKHREELKRWSEQTGFEIPQIPAGYTFVRPHFSPKETGERLKELPTFIRRRMQQELDEQVKDQVQES